MLQNPLDQPETIAVGWSIQGVEFIRELMQILNPEGEDPEKWNGVPALVILTPKESLPDAHAALSRFPDYAALRRQGRLFIRSTSDRGNLWLQDAMEIGWHPASGRNAVADLPHFESEHAARTMQLACGLESGPISAETIGSRMEITSDSRNHGGNLEGLPGNILLHGTGTSGTLLHAFQSADPELQTLEVETRWLDVGHVDELFALIPTSPEAGKGADRCSFALVRASPGLALELMGSSPEFPLEPALAHFYGEPPEPRKTGTCMDRFKTSYDGSPLSSREALRCRAFRSANQEYESLIATDAGRIRKALIDRTGCTEIPVIRFPTVFLPAYVKTERLRDFEKEMNVAPNAEFRVASALNPNPVNGVSLGGLLIIPEQPNEVFRRAILDELKRAAPQLRAEFISTSHLHFLKGEAHCGSQVIRGCTSEL